MLERSCVTKYRAAAIKTLAMTMRIRFSSVATTSLSTVDVSAAVSNHVVGFMSASINKKTPRRRRNKATKNQDPQKTITPRKNVMGAAQSKPKRRGTDTIYQSRKPNQVPTVGRKRHVGRNCGRMLLNVKSSSQRTRNDI
ncbi:unnamed protein product [Ixodes pacificus]